MTFDSLKEKEMPFRNLHSHYFLIFTKYEVAEWKIKITDVFV